MPVELQPWPMAAAAAVVTCWCAFAVIFLSRKKPPKADERKRDPASMLGMALQGVGFALAWGYRRRYFTPLVPMPQALEIALAIVTMAIALASAWLSLVAVRTLGKQWAFMARVVEGHKLVTEGPYHRVRNPIYLGMFGMMLATGLAFSTWRMLLAATAIFLLGTAIRVRIEEKLLRETFGAEFDAYVKRIPTLFPRLF